MSYSWSKKTFRLSGVQFSLTLNLFNIYLFVFNLFLNGAFLRELCGKTATGKNDHLFFNKTNYCNTYVLKIAWLARINLYQIIIDLVISVLAFMIQFEKFLRSVVENVEGNYQHFNNKLPVPIGTLTVRSIFVMIF